MKLVHSTTSDGDGAKATLKTPQRFFGDYEILDELARGGMGIVYRARQVSLNRAVALKMIAAGELATPAQVRRFRVEAEAAARLDNPNIVPIYEVGEHQGQHFYSMKLIEGGGFSKKNLETRIALLVKVARAVHYAHQRGVLHRDLKPTNILIDSQGEPYVADFGLAKLFEEDSTLTQSAAFIGTPAYMAPEVASGKASEATTAADVYSIGAILHELITGQPPFLADNIPAMLRKIVEEEPKLAGGDRDLNIICLKCLEKDPLRRYSSANALADDLDRWLTGEPIHARSASQPEKVWRWCRRRPLVSALLLTVSFLLVAGFIGALMSTAWIKREADRARRAEQDATEKLWRSYLAQARAQRLSGLAGRKNESLAAVKSATVIRPSVELRDEAIAALALTDVTEEGPWQTARANDFERPVFAPDLDRYAVGRRSGDISVFRLTTGEKLAEFQGPPGAQVIVRFSSTGQLLGAHFANGDVFLWSLTNNSCLLQCNVGHRGRNGLSFDLSPDDRTLALANGANGVRLLDLAVPAETQKLPLEGDSRGVSFRPDGQMLAVSVGSNLVLWSFAERAVMHVLPHPNEVTWFDWHPDGRQLAVACADSLDVWLWDSRSTNCLKLKGHLELIPNVAFNHRGDLLMSTAYDGSTRFWHAGSGELLFISRAGSGMYFGRDDTHIGFVREDQRLGVWKLSSSSIYREVTAPIGSMRRVGGFEFSPDGRWLVAANPEGVHVCDLRNGRPLAYASHRNNHAVSFTADGKSIVLVGADHLHRWDVTATAHEVQLQDKGRLEFKPRATLDAGSVTRGARQMLIVPSVDMVFCVDLSALPQAQDWWALPGVGYMNSAAISPDTNWIATSYWKDRGTYIWDTRTRKRAHDFGADGGFVTFSPDNRYLLVGSAHRYTLWEIETWRRVWELSRRAAGLVGRAAFSPDGRMIALCPEVNLLQLVETKTARKIASLNAPVPKNIAYVAFNPDGSTLAASTFDSEIELWDLPTLRRELATLNLDWQ